MIDYARITAKAGDGGNGAGSFFHIKGKRYGKADGGDGGNGGNVLLEATRDLNTLEPFRYIKDYKAKDGASGLSNHRKGADGEDLVVKVPEGTQVRMESPGTLRLSPAVIYDLTNDGDRVLVVRGGQGGRGNSKLRDEFGRRPRVGERGEEGEQSSLTLELKLIADVGLIGLPNAGKSTLLSALTKARPKIADYPFTTLEPNLGVLEVKVNSQSGKSENKNSPYTSDFDSRLILADIPGLIEGASKGKGLGDLFLRHIERTKVLVHLVDGLRLMVNGNVGDTMNSEPKTVDQFWVDYQTVRNELKAYSSELAKKKEIVVLNKIDTLSDILIQSAKALFARHRKKVITISAKTGEGLDKLVEMIFKNV